MSAVDATVMSSAPEKLRRARACASSVTMLMATDMPTAVSPPASAEATVTAWSVRLASMRKSPLRPMLAPLPTWARTVFSTTAIEIAAPMLVPPPVAPLSALVRAALSASAVTMKCPALPVTVSPFSISAIVSLSAMLSAIDAPTPTSPPLAPPPLGAAMTMFSVRLCAWMSTWAPLSVSTVALLGSALSALRPTTARVLTSAMLIATDPATPMSPPPAPEVASAWKLSVLSMNFCVALPSLVSSITVPSVALSRVAARPMRLPSITTT